MALLGSLAIPLGGGIIIRFATLTVGAHFRKSKLRGNHAALSRLQEKFTSNTKISLHAPTIAQTNSEIELSLKLPLLGGFTEPFDRLRFISLHATPFRAANSHVILRSNDALLSGFFCPFNCLLFIRCNTFPTL